MENKISYLNRTFEDYRNDLMGYTKQYYPDIAEDMNDASVGSWMLDVAANVADNLSYHIDRALQETSINTAGEKGSLYAIARNNGVKVPGPKSSVAEIEATCIIPVDNSTASSSELRSPDWSYAPMILRGTKVSSGRHMFEVEDNIDFAEQADVNGVSNRKIEPVRNSNGQITSYRITKTGIIVSGETKIYTKRLNANDIVPFMSIVIPDDSIIEIRSIIVKEGTNYLHSPEVNDFFGNSEIYKTKNECGVYDDTYRFFEVDSLSQQYLWGVSEKEGEPMRFNYRYASSYDKDGKPNGFADVYTIAKGEWKPVRRKFITEFTDRGFTRIVFGAGYQKGTEVDMAGATDYGKSLISSIVNNDSLGILPSSGQTMFVMYRRGGGKATNLPAGSISTIVNLSIISRGSSEAEVNRVRSSIHISNTSPSVSGRDMMNEDELRNYIKYYNGSQNRCVTLKDYEERIMRMPSRYGTPYKVGVTEENNKIMVYVLGCDAKGYLTSVLPNVMTENIQNYLSEYRMINDYVEIKSGRILNISFEVDFFYDRNYNPSDVSRKIIETIQRYMDINRHRMGDDIFIGDIEKEISAIDGLTNLIELRVYNEYDASKGYSSDRTTQKTMTPYECYGEESDGTDAEYGRDRIDLAASDKMLFSDSDTMIELKYSGDIRLRPKSR